VVELKEARHWKPLDSGKVECLLCPVACKLAEDKVGVCLGRKNVEGKLHAVNYGQAVSIAIDPIEKKPLYHFYPGSQILSVGPNGCNLRCQNCQNWEIAQAIMPTRFVAASELIETALSAKSIGIAYTYSEPLIWYEYIYDVALLSRDRRLKTVLVTNGYINEEPFRELAPLIDAMNIDIKSMNPRFYQDVCKGSVDDVLRTVTIAVEAGIAVEITNLVITGLNDSDDDFQMLVSWIAKLNRKIPLHFSRYFPHHRMNLTPTPIERLARAYEIASTELDYVYVGNVDLVGAGDTRCPSCRNLLVSRRGYAIDIVGIADRKCSQCRKAADFCL
jgi:pyruvate formate lyase activating enzyme